MHRRPYRNNIPRPSTKSDIHYSIQGNNSQDRPHIGNHEVDNCIDDDLSIVEECIQPRRPCIPRETECTPWNKSKLFRINKRIFLYVFFVSMVYAAVLVCQQLSTSEEIAEVKKQFCVWRADQESFNRKIIQEVNAEVKARIYLVDKMNKLSITVTKQPEEVAKLHCELTEAINRNLTQISRHLSGSVKGMKDMFKEEISTYNADKNNRTDYALGSAGGRIVSTRNTETYSLAEPTYFLGVIPVCQVIRLASTILDPSVYPGECWPVEGSQASATIQLLGDVHISGVSMEHIPKALSPTGNIDTAPQDFSIWGLAHMEDQEGFFFGKFTYDSSGESLQYFDTVHKAPRSYNYVELKVHSNHGHPDYTCIYRIRIHGDLAVG